MAARQPQPVLELVRSTGEPFEVAQDGTDVCVIGEPGEPFQVKLSLPGKHGDDCFDVEIEINGKTVGYSRQGDGTSHTFPGYPASRDFSKFFPFIFQPSMSVSCEAIDDAQLKPLGTIKAKVFRTTRASRKHARVASAEPLDRTVPDPLHVPQGRPGKYPGLTTVAGNQPILLPAALNTLFDYKRLADPPVVLTLRYDTMDGWKNRDAILHDRPFEMVEPKGAIEQQAADRRRSTEAMHEEVKHEEVGRDAVKHDAVKHEAVKHEAVEHEQAKPDKGRDEGSSEGATVGTTLEAAAVKPENTFPAPADETVMEKQTTSDIGVAASEMVIAAVPADDAKRLTDVAMSTATGVIGVVVSEAAISVVPAEDGKRQAEDIAMISPEANGGVKESGLLAGDPLHGGDTVHAGEPIPPSDVEPPSKRKKSGDAQTSTSATESE